MKKFTQLLSVQLMTALLVACGGEGTDTPVPTQGNAPQETTESTPANYQVSGHILVKRDTRHDSDVNDPNAAFAANNSFAQAQALDTASVIGGYVNVASAGAHGRSFLEGDNVDIYAVTLVADQEVSLIFETAGGTNDLDLYLFESSDLNNPVAASTGTTAAESLRVDSDGEYFIKVVARHGSSSYRLALTGGVGASSIQTFGMNFVPGEVLVKYRTPTLRTLSDQGLVARQVSKLSLDELLAEDPSLWSGQGTEGLSVRSLFVGDEQAQLKQKTLSMVRALQARDDIEYVEPNYLFHVSAIPNDPYYSNQPHYSLINLPQAWEQETGSPNVIVAVIDTGVAMDHPDLVNKLVPGYDFVSNAAMSGDGDGIDSNPDDPGDPTSSIAFHGTHVAGTIAAQANNSEGGVGVAWGARIMPLRALTYQSGSSFDVAQAILFAAGLRNNSGTVPTQRADVINLSLGGISNSTTIARAISQARTAGSIVVAAAGNASSSTPNYPAANEGVVSVGAINAKKQLTHYSNFGPTIDIVAPGGESGDRDNDGRSDAIFSTIRDHNGNSSYGFMNGSSMATPHVSGVLALMKSVYPGLTPDDVDALISGGMMTSDLGLAGRDNQFGHGLIDAQKAIEATIRASGERVSVSASTLHFGLVDDVRSLVLSAASPEATERLEIVPQQSWITILPVAVQGSGMGSYRVEIDRSALDDGTHFGAVLVSTQRGDSISVAVVVVVSEIDVNADAGQAYVFLRHSITGDFVGPVEAELNEGVYHFNFPMVPEGAYHLMAGSDANNDRYVCGLGESCGAYPSADQPMVINIDRDESGLGFVTEYVEHSAGLQGLSVYTLYRPEYARY